MKIPKTENEWKKKLTRERYHVMREKGTEIPFTGKLLRNKDKRDYTCGACGTKLFSSDTKFDSGCGWPSFYDADKTKVEFVEDDSLGMKRIEVRCRNCGGHLGHLFDDGPKPTGKRYCINSVSLRFVKGK